MQFASLAANRPFYKRLPIDDVACHLLNLLFLQSMLYCPTLHLSQSFASLWGRTVYLGHFGIGSCEIGSTPWELLLFFTDQLVAMLRAKHHNNSAGFYTLTPLPCNQTIDRYFLPIWKHFITYKNFEFLFPLMPCSNIMITIIINVWTFYILHINCRNFKRFFLLFVQIAHDLL